MPNNFNKNRGEALWELNFFENFSRRKNPFFGAKN